MAKTKRQEAWGLFGKDGELVFDDPLLVACETKEGAELVRFADETVRPVTISWKVKQEDLPTFEDMKGILKEEK